MQKQSSKAWNALKVNEVFLKRITFTILDNILNNKELDAAGHCNLAWKESQVFRVELSRWGQWIPCIS